MRNSKSTRWGGLALAAAVLLAGALGTGRCADTPASDPSQAQARVVVVRDPEATKAYEPQRDRIRQMVQRALTNLTSTPSVTQAWLSLVSTQDTIGLKVHAAPGPTSGTRPAVVEAVIESLIAAGVPANHIVVWDKQLLDLQQAGFATLEDRYGVRLAGSANAGYDKEASYQPEFPIIGKMIWSDLEFGQTTEGAGRKSYVSKLVSQQLTKIINIAPLLNHYKASVTGTLYTLAIGSVDNTQRFELQSDYLAQAVPEIYALQSVGDKVVLNIVDALICQYQGQQVGRLHYAAVLNELRFSRDPVALDMLSVQTLAEQRRQAAAPATAFNKALFDNAALLQLGTCDLGRILTERLTL